MGSREEGDGPAGTAGSQARPSVSLGLSGLLAYRSSLVSNLQNSKALPGLKSLALWGMGNP